MKRKSLQRVPAPVGSWHAAPPGQSHGPAKLGSPSGQPCAPAQPRVVPCQPCASAARRGADGRQRFARELAPSWIRPSRSGGWVFRWGMRCAEAGMRD